MQLIEGQITLDKLKEMSLKMYNQLVKAVVDIEKEIIVVDAELHADQEELLLEHESEQQNLWGINLYPEKFGTLDFVEFDSMINIRPSQGNYSRGIDNQDIQQKIISIINKVVKS